MKPPINLPCFHEHPVGDIVRRDRYPLPEMHIRYIERFVIQPPVKALSRPESRPPIQICSTLSPWMQHFFTSKSCRVGLVRFQCRDKKPERFPCFFDGTEHALSLSFTS